MLSEYVPVAVYCCGVVGAMIKFAGVTSMDMSTRGATDRVTELEVIFPNAALIVVVPKDNEVASPVLLMVATAEVDEFQITDAVRS